MSYVSEFEYDIFISYAHDDNTLQWVDLFHDYLKKMLQIVFGKKHPINIWRDSYLDCNQMFDEAIKNTLEETALFIALLSSNYLKSSYCLKELDWFCQHIDKKGESLHHGKSYSRIIHVLLTNISQEQWPGALRGKPGIQFYDESFNVKPGLPFNVNDKRFDPACRKLVSGIYNVLTAMKNNCQVNLVEPPESSQNYSLKKLDIAEEPIKLSSAKLSKKNISDKHPDIHLTIRQKSLLISNLLECSVIKDRQTRDAIVNELPPDIKHSINRDFSDRGDVNNIVSICLEFPLGIESLIYIVSQYERDSKSLQKIYDFIATILCLDSPISNQYLSELLFILDKVTVQFNSLQTCYRASLPPFFKFQSEPQSIWQLIANLSNIPIQEDKNQPIVQFVQSIADQLLSGKESELLTNWVRHLSKEYGLISKNVICQSETCNYEINSNPIYLLVHLITDPNNRNNEIQKFAVCIYAWRNPDEVPCVYTNGSCDKNKILNIIDDVIDSKFDENEDIRAIEFILPCDLLHLDVNELKRNDVFEWNSGLINDYQVVVRLDRYYYQGRRLKRHFRDRWKKKWNRFKTTNENVCANKSILMVCNHENYNARKVCIDFSDDTEKTCLMQTFFPKNSDDFGLALLNAGIPVAVWCKKYGHQKYEHEIIKNALLKLIEDGNLTKLPDRIHKICRKPEQKKHLQDYLILLWDDPGRLPKDLQEPQN